MLKKNYTHLFFQFFTSLVDSSGIYHDLIDLPSLPPPPLPLHPMKPLSPPPHLSFPDQKQHLFDAFVVVGTFPGFEAGPPTSTSPSQPPWPTAGRYSRYIACFLQIHQQPILPALPFSLCSTLSEDWCLVLCPESALEKLSM
jgi:hypothetical protein